ncbi:MAG: penicillin-binding protein 1A [Burkholderiales bacterium]|nr:penicillin-binding protein 1A [Burkholderiales bacterium]
MLGRWLLYIFFGLLGLGVIFAGLIGFAAVMLYPNLPSLEVLKDYRPKVPLRVFTEDGVLIGEFGEERRAVVDIRDVPKLMKEAILSAEDERFYEHGGIDYQGVMRSAWINLIHGGTRQGASTITMQVARNFFLTKEKTFTRKFNEALLSFKIEHNLTKDEILQLYINQIYLGQKAYGFAAAAQVYFGKPMDKLSVAEMATLAGLPKAPSAYNPVVNPGRSKQRQLYVLHRMRVLGFITEDQYQKAVKEPIKVRHARHDYPVKGEYLAEMVRQDMYDRYKEQAYTMGYRVYTTLRWADQVAAYQAVRKGVMDYDERHPYRGPEKYFDLPDSETRMDEILDDYDASEDILPALVLESSTHEVAAWVKGKGRVVIGQDGLKRAKSMLEKSPSKMKPGALIRVQMDEKKKWEITELPTAEAALISVSPQTGAIRALVGGFDFNQNQFNHVTQAWRQPGSSFKPFIYSAALEKGFTPATIVDDAPLVFTAEQTGSVPWEPKNYEGTYDGPMRIRVALAESKNLVAILILQSIGPTYAQDYITRFGFDPKMHPPYLTMALGAGSVTPWQMAGAYSVFANGGYRVNPYYIEKIEDQSGHVIAQAKPVVSGMAGSSPVIDPRNAFIMTSMMQDVIKYGTGASAMKLGRHDLAGKTGTTNDQVDAWFAGFQPTLTTIAWIGYDQPKTLGRGETGARAALPIWMGYMEKALQGVPEATFTMPQGVVEEKVDPKTGQITTASDGIMDYFYQENQPKGTAIPASGALPASSPDPLF